MTPTHGAGRFLRIGIYREKNDPNFYGVLHAIRQYGLPFVTIDENDLIRAPSKEYSVICFPNAADVKPDWIGALRQLCTDVGLVLMGNLTQTASKDLLSLLGIKKIVNTEKDTYSLTGFPLHPITHELITEITWPHSYTLTSIKPEDEALILAQFTNGDQTYPALLVKENVVYFSFDIGERIITHEMEWYMDYEQRNLRLSQFLMKLHQLSPSFLRKIAYGARHRLTEWRIPKAASENWYIDLTADVLKSLLSNAVIFTSGRGFTASLARWKSGTRFAVVITHDVETRYCYDAGVRALEDVERSSQVHSTWNFVPMSREYDLNADLPISLNKYGHEIGVHGLYHDGFFDIIDKGERVRRINTAKRKMQMMIDKPIQGFRAPWALRTRDLWETLETFNFLYDSSYPDIDYVTPGRVGGGVHTCFPYHPIAKKNMDYSELKLLELPITMPQDWELLNARGLKAAEALGIWIKKLNAISKLGGLALFPIHPANYDMGNAKNIPVYEELLRRIKAISNAWVTTAEEIAKWWSSREKIELEAKLDENSLVIVIRNYSESDIEGLQVNVRFPLQYKFHRLDNVNLAYELKHDNFANYVRISIPLSKKKSEMEIILKFLVSSV